MARIIDTPPDRIVKTESGQYLFYFAGGKDLDALPVGAKYVVVYSPTIYSAKGRVVLYRIALGPGIVMLAMVVKQRDLTAEEITHFEGLIASGG